MGAHQFLSGFLYVSIRRPSPSVILVTASAEAGHSSRGRKLQISTFVTAVSDNGKRFKGNVTISEADWFHKCKVKGEVAWIRPPTSSALPVWENVYFAQIPDLVLERTCSTVVVRTPRRAAAGEKRSQKDRLGLRVPINRRQASRMLAVGAKCCHTFSGFLSLWPLISNQIKLTWPRRYL